MHWGYPVLGIIKRNEQYWIRSYLGSIVYIDWPTQHPDAFRKEAISFCSSLPTCHTTPHHMKHVENDDNQGLVAQHSTAT